MEGDLGVFDQSGEFAICSEAKLTGRVRCVPVAKAVVKDRALIVSQIKARTELIAVTEIIPVFIGEVAEADAFGIALPAGCRNVEGMNITQVIAALHELDADLNLSDSHIGEGII